LDKICEELGVSNSVYDKSCAATIMIGLSNSNVDIDQELLDNIMEMAQNTNDKNSINIDTDNHIPPLVISYILSISP
jgi:hypothetical protein